MSEHAGERRFRIIFNSVHDALIIHNQEGGIIDMNRRARDMFGLGRNASPTATIADLTAVETDYRLLPEVWNAVLAGEEREFEWLVRRHSDGFIFDVDVHLKRIDLEEGPAILAGLRDITEKKRIENSLKESERQFREILQNIALPAVQLNRSGKIIFINDFLLKMTGWDRSEVIGEDWFSIFIPYGQELSKLIFDTGIHNGTIPALFENDIITRTGKRRYISWTNTLLRDNTGHVIGLSSIGQDFTRRKKTDQLLMESEERYRILYENNHTVMLLIDLESGKLVDANPAAEDFYGHSRAELAAMSINDLSCLDPAIRLSMFNEMRRTQSCIRINSWHRVKNGDIRDVEVYCTLLRIHGRRTVHAIVHDITERLMTEQALKESQERFRSVFDQSDEAILLARLTTGEIVYANAAVRNILGVEASELIRKQVSHLAHLFPGHDLVEALDGLSEKSDILLPHITRPGAQDIIVSIRFRVFTTGTEHLIHISFREITDRIRLEEATKAAQGRLFHANKLSSLGMLVSGIAHEINNPNNFMLFNSEMLTDIWKDVACCLDESYTHRQELTLAGLPYAELREAVPKLLGGLVEGSARIKNIIDGLRQFSRQDSGVRRQFDLNEAVLKATAMLTPEIKKHTDRFSLQLTEDTPLITGRREQIEQVIINLAINALQSLRTKTDGVCISTKKEKNYISVSIRDEGCGMDVETLARVSEPFFTTKEESGGTGLGIFISQSIVAEHGGSLRFDSFKGEGTTATVRLPITLAPSGGAAQ